MGIDASFHVAEFHGHAEQQIQYRHADATRAAGRAEFAGSNAFNANAINFITTQFANATTGGQFSLSRTGGQVFLTFAPVPEPAVILGVAFASLVGWRLRRRRGSATAN